MRRVGAAFIFVFLLAACGGGGSGGNPTAGHPQSGRTAGTPKSGGTATIALESELRTLDPLDSSLLVEREVFYNIYDSLFAIDPSLKISAGFVKPGDASDQTTYH